MPEFHLPACTAQEALRRPNAHLIDVRREAALQASGKIVADARWIDPLALDHRHDVLRARKPLIFYCAHGHEISQFAAALALLHKCDACFVRHGFAALVDAGAPLSEVLP
ncbi:MAG: rhodanese-like domain-containing protein, partial [Pseudomonadota bacterium]